jgi:hypothetical protein
MMGLNLEGVREGQQGIEALSLRVESVAWEKKSDEPLTWFNRFERYRLLGPQRSLDAASQRCAQVEGQRCAESSRTWYGASRRWQWQERARAWNATQPSPLPGEEEAHRSEAHQEYLEAISKIFAAASPARLPHATLLVVIGADCSSALRTVQQP